MIVPRPLPGGRPPGNPRATPTQPPAQVRTASSVRFSGVQAPGAGGTFQYSRTTSSFSLTPWMLSVPASDGVRSADEPARPESD